MNKRRRTVVRIQNKLLKPEAEKRRKFLDENYEYLLELAKAEKIWDEKGHIIGIKKGE